MTNSTKEEFLLLYYQWAREDFDREIREGWPLLSRLPNRIAARVIRHLKSIPIESREELIRAKLKLFHPVATKLMGDEMTERESKMVDAFIMSTLYPLPEEEALKSKGPMQRRKFMGHAQAALRRVLGEDVQAAAPDEDWFFTEIGPVRVKTVASYEKVPSCEHRLFVGKEQIYRSASILSWLGIASVTDFDIIPRGEEEQAAELLAELCGHYLTAVRDIVGRMTTLS